MSEKCYFCGCEDLTFTNEHYVFCHECMALYTEMMLQSSNCEHIEDGAPVVLHAPVYAKYRNKPYILEAPKGCCPEQYCSVCGAGCVSDGW